MPNDSPSASEESEIISSCLMRLKAGDEAALNDLLESSTRRIEVLSRKIKRSFPVVSRWEQTEDVAQNATIRLQRALRDSTIESTEHYYRLMALQIRRELLDLARRHSGPHGVAANHRTQRLDPADSANSMENQFAEATNSGDPQQLMQWIEFHEAIEGLSPDDQLLFDLLWYHDMTQQEAEDVTGCSLRTLKRRWRDAKLSLHELLHEPD